MAISESLQLLDFSHPRRPRLRKWRVLSTWHSSLCTLASESWNGLMQDDISFTPARVEPFQQKEALEQIPDRSMGLHVVVGPNRFPSVITFPQKLLHGLLACVLNIPGDEWPELRPFTRAEHSILKVLFQMLAAAIAEGIPGPEATHCEMASVLDRPERTRLFALCNEMFVLDISVSCRFGAEQIHWLLPRSETETLIGHELREEEIEDRPIRPQMVALTQKINVNLMVELGRAEIRMNEIARLAVGDVLVLDQSIHRPLDAFVENSPKLTGKPVRVGLRQGFAVTEIIRD